MKARAKALTSNQAKRSTRGASNSNSISVENMMQHWTLKTVVPITPNQHLAKEAFDKGLNVGMIGTKGTGKTYLGLYMAIKWLMDSQTDGLDKKIVILRSTVQVRDEGFQPGNHKDKASPYESRYRNITNQLLMDPKAYMTLKAREKIIFDTTAFLRGEEFEDAIVLIDECQNMNYHELDTCLGRLGQGCRLILCGDTKQDDLAVGRNKKDVSGLQKMLEILSLVKSYRGVRFGVEDVVRSGFVKELILAEEEWERRALNS